MVQDNNLKITIFYEQRLEKKNNIYNQNQLVNIYKFFVNIYKFIYNFFSLYIPRYNLEGSRYTQNVNLISHLNSA